jgi:hypothetical protein
MKRLIKTLRSDGREGIYMSEELYYSLQIFFIAVLTEQSQLTLAELIALAEKKLPSQFIPGIGFNMIHMKSDLLARNVIKQTSTGHRAQLPLISLKGKAKSVRHDKNLLASDRRDQTLTVL